MNNVYFVLYGEFDYMKGGDEQFGERCGLGWTIGEEILFHEPEEDGGPPQPLKRMETVVAHGPACLLQLKIADLTDMLSGGKIGGGATMQKDYDTLMSFLTSNYETKTNWRKNVGILPSSPKNTMSKFGTFRSTQSRKMVNFSPDKHPQDTNSQFY